MTKTLKTIALSLLAVCLLASLAGAQTLLANTTLAAAVYNTVSTAGTTGNRNVVNLTSATGVSAPTANTGNTAGYATSEAQSYLYVDRELMQVKAVSGTYITVVRGVGSTAAASHASGALVFVIPAAALNWSGGALFSQLPQGFCTRTSELYLPRIQFITGVISDCLGGQWIAGDAAQTTRSAFGNLMPLPPIGATAITALETNGTATAANTEAYCTELDLPYSVLMTGLAVANGTTATTDSLDAGLYDASGNRLAVTAVSIASGASTYQKRAFTTPYYAVGPARYFACVQATGQTATLRHAVTGTNDSILGGTITGLPAFSSTSTLPATITVPSSFTTAKVPYFAVY